MKKYTADFETTTKEDDCRVWAYAISEIGNPDYFDYGNSLDDFMEICADPKQNAVYYFHNLKFDGQFIIYWLFKNGYEFIEDKKDRRDKTFTTLITDMGQFYSIEVYFKADDKKHINKVKFLDSLKILNFSVEQIAKDFDLPISKLSIDYKAERPIGHQLTAEEVAYIRNDVEIMSRALQIMFDEGLTKMTIASDALADYKTTMPNFKQYFPMLPPEIDADIRQSYKGGFTYLNPLYKGKTTGSGIVFDSNSMYPARMYNELLPYSEPKFFNGRYQNDPLYPLYVQRLTCVFKLKKGKIPSIQIKHNRFFIANEYLEDSEGLPVTLTLTSVDLELFLENYDIENPEWGGGWKFKAMQGLFSDYIDKWTAKKIQAKKDGNSALYRIAKLCLNSLYGKFGTSSNSRKKIPHLTTDKSGVKFTFGKQEQKDTVYIPMASFITSYARANIIRASEQIREYSMKKYGYDAYVYSDTDSIHCLLNEDDVKELSKTMDIDDYRLGAWKLESTFKAGKYLRQKCYIEMDETDKINVTVAGLPKKLGKYINFDNFDIGFTTEGMDIDEPKLTYKRVEGGVLLVGTDFTIK